MSYYVIHTDTLSPFKAKKRFHYPSGTALDYHSDYKDKDSCFCPPNYKWLRLGLDHYCFKHPGSDCALIPTFYPPTDIDMGGDDLTDLVSSNIDHRAVQQLRRGLDLKWIVLGAITIVAIIAIAYIVKSVGGS